MTMEKTNKLPLKMVARRRKMTPSKTWGGSVQVFDVDGEQLLLDRDSGVLHRTGDTSHERVPLAASWPPAAGSRAGDRGGKRALDSAAENSAGLSLDGTASTEVTQ